MKTSNKILIYDDNCPLCKWYTSLFVRYKLLKPENRVAFSSAPEKLISMINLERAKDEIPLIDKTTHTVLYGFDALINLVGERFAFVEKVGRLQPLNWMFKKLYKFVSFNRKVVVAKKCGKDDIDCSPSFSLLYRLLFVFFSVAACLAMLPVIHVVLNNWLPYYTGSLRQLFLCAALLASVTYSACAFLEKDKAMEYLGQHAMLGIIVLLLLSPLMFLQHLPAIPVWLVTPYFSFIAYLLIKEYLRRMRYITQYKRQTVTMIINTLSSVAFIICLFVEL